MSPRGRVAVGPVGGAGGSAFTVGAAGGLVRRGSGLPEEKGPASGPHARSLVLGEAGLFGGALVIGPGTLISSDGDHPVDRSGRLGIGVILHSPTDSGTRV